MPHFNEIKQRHKGRIALQFSGGKDSLLCLFRLREHWDDLTVYWLNAGDPFPETLRLIELVKGMVPHFVEVKGCVEEVRAKHGMPSDIVPSCATLLGRTFGEVSPLLQSRYACCFAAKVMPLHERMLADGVTLIIRGQRNDEKNKAPFSSGAIVDGIEYYFPIEDMSAAQVYRELERGGAPMPRYCEEMDSSPDCMNCTAWWDEGRARYLRRYHPVAYEAYQNNMQFIRHAVDAHIHNFNKEINF